MTVRFDDASVQAALDGMAREFGPRNSKKPIQNVVRKALRQALPTLRSNAPVDTGQLRKSARVRVGSSRDGNTIIGRLGFRAPRDTDRAVALLASEVGVGGRPPFGRAIERTFDQKSSEMASYVVTNLASEIESQWRRYAAAAGRGTLRVR